MAINRDELFFNLAKMCKTNKLNVEEEISEMIKRRIRDINSKINIRGSSLVSFESNSLHFAVLQFLGVCYGNNANTIIGTAVHDATDFAYKQILAIKSIPSEEEINDVIDDSIKKV